MEEIEIKKETQKPPHLALKQGWHTAHVILLSDDMDEVLMQRRKNTKEEPLCNVFDCLNYLVERKLGLGNTNEKAAKIVKDMTGIEMTVGDRNSTHRLKHFCTNIRPSRLEILLYYALISKKEVINEFYEWRNYTDIRNRETPIRERLEWHKVHDILNMPVTTIDDTESGVLRLSDTYSDRLIQSSIYDARIHELWRLAHGSRKQACG